MSETPICDYLRWDSEFFGKRIARFRGGSLTAESGRALEAYCKMESIDCVYLLADSPDMKTVRVAESQGFSLMDVRMTFSHDLSAARLTKSKASVPIRPGDENDYAQLRGIAGAVFEGTRFFMDEKLCAKAPELYRIWVEKSLQGDAEVLVSESDLGGGGISGFITCDIDGEAQTGTIGLVGVDSAHRGKGIGRLLVEAVLTRAAAQGLQFVQVVTQGRNLPAQALYQRTGFVSSSVQLWFHKWYQC